MTNDFNKFIRGKTKNNMNSNGLMLLIVLVVPSFILDIYLIAVFLTGKPWFDFALSININPAFGIWFFVCLAFNGFNIFFLTRAMRSNRDTRIEPDENPMN